MTVTSAATRAAALAGIEEWLAAGLPGSEGMRAMHRWALLPAGKLLRPALLLESAAVVGGDRTQVLPAAVGMELVHTGSLIHDDIIDNDGVRRGRPAVHREFGRDRAILAGDSLLFSLFEALGGCRARGVPDDRIADAMQLLAQAGRDITLGVLQELDLSGSPHGDVDGYLEMARLKTAALIRAACQTGAVLGGGSREECAALSEFGEALGIAFQIRDDLLPYTKIEEGKPATSDLQNRRPALPLLLAYRLGGAEEVRLLVKLFENRAEDPETGQRQLHELVASTGALEAAQKLAEQHLNRCRRALATLPDPRTLPELVEKLSNSFTAG